MCVWVYTYAHVDVYIFTHTMPLGVLPCMHQIRVYVCMYAYSYGDPRRAAVYRIYVSQVRVYVYIYVCIHVHLHTHSESKHVVVYVVCKCTYICVLPGCVCMCIHIYLHTYSESTHVVVYIVPKVHVFMFISASIYTHV